MQNLSGQKIYASMVRGFKTPPVVKVTSMTDALGWRRKFGVLGPSTNTIVQPDFDDMRPRGVTNHYSRIFTPNANAVSNESFRAGAEVIAANVLDAVRSVMTCSPDYLVMGMSAVTFFDGEKGADRFTREVEEESRHQDQHRQRCLHRRHAGLWRRQAHRHAVALLARDEHRGGALFHRQGFYRRARQVPAMPVMDPDRRSRPRRRCAPR